MGTPECVDPPKKLGHVMAGKAVLVIPRGGQLIRSRHSVLSCHIRYHVWEWQPYPRSNAVLGVPALRVCRRFVRQSMGT